MSTIYLKMAVLSYRSKLIHKAILRILSPPYSVDNSNPSTAGFCLFERRKAQGTRTYIPHMKRISFKDRPLHARRNQLKTLAIKCRNTPPITLWILLHPEHWILILSELIHLKEVTTSVKELIHLKEVTTSV